MSPYSHRGTLLWWAFLITRLTFAVTLIVVLATLPSGSDGCAHALEHAASTTHSFGLLVMAWIALVTNWINVVAHVCLVIKPSQQQQQG